MNGHIILHIKWKDIEDPEQVYTSEDNANIPRMVLLLHRVHSS